MAFLSRLLGKIKRDKPTQFIRWSADEILEKKQYLEGKDAHTFEREDWYLVVEWLFQRYLPEDHVISQEQWQKRFDELKAKVDANFDAYKSGKPRIKEPVQDDPEFAAWLDNLLKRKPRD